MSHKCIELTEYKPLYLERSNITEDIGNKILTRFSNYIDIDFPNPKTQWRWRLMSLGWAGIININTQTAILLHPKIPTNNIFAMWEYAYKLKSFKLLKGIVDCDSMSGFYNRIAFLLSKQIIQRCKKGLFKSYIDVSDRLPFIAGRVDIKDTLYHAGSAFLKCNFQENTVNNEYNQILLWTLEVMRKTGELSGSRTIIVQAYRSLHGLIDLIPFTSLDCIQKNYNSLNEDYKLMHSLCRFILELAAPNCLNGNKKVMPYLVNMSRLYELFVAEWLKVNLRYDIGIKTQEHITYGTDDRITFNIDIVLYSKASGESICVLDTKYKNNDKISKSDLHQIISYMEVKECSIGILLYPSDMNNIKKYPINTKTVYQIEMDICGNIEDAGQMLLKVINNIITRHNLLKYKSNQLER